VKIPLIDLVAQYRSIESEINAAVREVLESGDFILGRHVRALEEDVAAYLNLKHAIGVASGTDALVLSLRSLGIGPGDEVLVPAYTFFATAEAVLLVGAIPIFLDIRPDTYCLDIDQIRDRLTPRTKAIIPVHLYGQAVDMLPLLEIARQHGLRVIEDAAQAFGAECAGRKTAGFGDVGCLSFFPTKNLGAYGDGGMVVTNDDNVASLVRMLRTHGWRKKYYPELVGYNSRLDELQAAILGVKLRYVDTWNARRSYLARLYAENFRDVPIKIPFEADYGKHVYHVYVIGVKERNRIEAALKRAGIGCSVYYPQALHLVNPCLKGEKQDRSFPVAEAASQETLAIPLYPEMSEDQVRDVTAAVKKAVLAA
jgi:dTDP-4-amino-4,6-dideoxygalactose transaminase